LALCPCCCASGLVLRCANPSEATAEDVAALLLGMNIRDMVRAAGLCRQEGTGKRGMAEHP
jgi:hypothetical protein